MKNVLRMIHSVIRGTKGMEDLKPHSKSLGELSTNVGNEVNVQTKYDLSNDTVGCLAREGDGSFSDSVGRSMKLVPRPRRRRDVA